MINKHEEIALRAGVANSKIVMQLQTSAVGGDPSPANWLACSGLRVEFSRPNIAGAVLLPLTIDGDVLTLNFPDGFPEGDNVVRVSGNYGCCRFSYGVMVNADLYADIVETIEADPLVIETAAAGGGAEYKTDVYMDGDGRVMVERTENGSTTIYDEHESPIVTRRADGTTEYYDAYQNPKLHLAANGALQILSQGGNVTAIETKSNGDLVLKTYNGNELRFDNSGDVSIRNYKNEVVASFGSLVNLRDPNGDDSFQSDGYETKLIFKGDDRVVCNRNGVRLVDANGVDAIFIDGEIGVGVRYPNDETAIFLHSNGLYLRDGNGEDFLRIKSGKLELCYNGDYLLKCNENGITIYDTDAEESVTFTPELIRKLNDL